MTKVTCTRGNHNSRPNGRPRRGPVHCSGHEGSRTRRGPRDPSPGTPHPCRSYTRAFKILFDSKLIPHEETLHLTTRPNVEERVVGHHQLVEVEFVSKPFPFCFMKDPLVVIVSVNTGTCVGSSPTWTRLLTHAESLQQLSL